MTQFPSIFSLCRYKGFLLWFGGIFGVILIFLILELRLVIIAWHCNKWWLNATEWEEILTQNNSVAVQMGVHRKLSALAFKQLDQMSQHSELSPTALAWINLQTPCALRRPLPSSLVVFCLQWYAALLKKRRQKLKKKKRGTHFSLHNGNKYWHHISEKKKVMS